jgi:murein L,D-transpeptidase YafK
MKKTSTFILLFFIGLNIFAQSDFLSQQKKYSRVRTAIGEKEDIVNNDLKKHDIVLSQLNILIVAYKFENEFDIYIKSKTETEYKKLKTYKICSNSGELGPKRMQGDYQVPEGYYYIDRFNPYSNFYLSLGINYPNKSDRIKSSAKNLGGDIFIHGDCVTIGCIPLTDDKIKEIYLYAINARNNGQKQIPVYIFPFKMTNENFVKHSKNLNSESELIDFWINLKLGYDKFIKSPRELNLTIGESGNYKFQ